MTFCIYFLLKFCFHLFHSPEPPPQLFGAPPRRDRGAGRPTKRERRALDRLRGRDLPGVEHDEDLPEDRAGR